MRSSAVLLVLLATFLALAVSDDVYPEEIDYEMCKCSCADFAKVDIPDPPFVTSSNCVRIKAMGDHEFPGGYLFILDSFGENHTVFHDLWFKRNKYQHRWLSGGFWRIFYPWINATATSDTIPFVVQNILTREYLTVSTVYEDAVFRWIYAGPRLVQRSMWKFEMKRGGDRITRWTLQNQKTDEWLLQHPKMVGDNWWKGRIFGHNRKLWDDFRDGGIFWVHPCY